MPINLSFPESRSTGDFYTAIHTTMVDQTAVVGLPPTVQEFADWLARRFPEDVAGMSALDAGCGAHGFNAQACHDHGIGSVRAIDINPDVAASLGRARAAIDFRAGSVLDIPFDVDSFDLVVCSGVAHHTEDPSRAFTELARVTRPGGTVYVSLYAFRGSLVDWFVRFLRLLAHVVPFRLMHRLFSRVPVVNNFVLDHMYVSMLWLYRADEATRLLEERGLQVVDSFPSSFDVFSRWPLGRLISGDGLLRVFVCEKSS